MPAYFLLKETWVTKRLPAKTGSIFSSRSRWASIPCKTLIPGFNPFFLNQVPVTADKTTEANIVLQVGSTRQSVTVEARELPLNMQVSGMVALVPSATPRVRESSRNSALAA